MIYLDVAEGGNAVELQLEEGSKVYVSKNRHTQYRLSESSNLILHAPKHGMVKIQGVDGFIYFYIIRQEVVEKYVENDPFIIRTFKENPQPKWIELSKKTCC